MCKKANGDVEHLHVYEPRRLQRHLGLQKYTWNTPASTDLEPQERLAKSPPSLSFSLPCASFTHTTPGVSRRLNPSVRIDHWRAAAQSRGATLGASLLGGIIQKIIFSQLSLLRAPKSRKSVPSVERIQNSTSPKNPLAQKIILRVLRTYSQVSPQSQSCCSRDHRLLNSVRTCGGFLHLAWVILFYQVLRWKKRKAVDNITPFHQKQVA